ncbi:glycerophosphodiester phosphodiesterase family protein [Paludibacterium paludis]|uniref:Hydrolase n=1 Tax=Paludibacterium paludis TaxID=1225769 RepID=A0A918P0L8_9NEIS|nr:glycerophosphodiester phosphodiesterase family protein [Paludibacterium paludis]GGY09934.1 hydrolase [Paludibacterium paludis]
MVARLALPLVLAVLVTTACTSLPKGNVSSSPLLIAHRAGTGDAPENTLPAIDEALRNGADGIWLSVQLSADGIPVLYRPADLSALTNAHGPVSAWTAEQLAILNAGFTFKTLSGKQPYRDNGPAVPTLDEALARIPVSVPVFLDLKSEPAAPLVEAVARVVTARDAWPRVRFYSTLPSHMTALSAYPQAQRFETRDATRNRIAAVALSGRCDAPPAGTWAGIELKRRLTVGETFTLGTVSAPVDAVLWTESTVACFKTHPDTHIVMFGIDSDKDAQTARQLGADAVLSDSPAKMRPLLPQ